MSAFGKSFGLFVAIGGLSTISCGAFHHNPVRWPDAVLPSATIPIVHDSSDAAKHVLVVMNSASQDSEAVATYYVKARHIPVANLVTIQTATTEGISFESFQSQELDPIKEAIQKCPNSIDYIVLTRGVPYYTNTGYGYSCDALLAGMDLTQAPISKLDDASINADKSPYFGTMKPFTHAQYGMYLVTRLDGYSLADAKALVDHSLAARKTHGPFYFMGSPVRTTGSFGELQDLMKQTNDLLTKQGYQSVYTDGKQFTGPAGPVIGYCSWGSNNGPFDQKVFASTQFLPGAIAETFVSTSAKSLRTPVDGQSQIGWLIKAGVTGVKGYVIEPFTFALCRPNILFEAYIHGFNLAESFYLASPVIKWRDVVIGDPLCDPFGS